MASPEQRKLHREWMLFRALNMKSVVAIVGSGCTIPLGYPTWPVFVHRLLSDMANALADFDEKEERKRIEACLLELTAKDQPANRLMYYIGVCQDAVRRNRRLAESYADSIRALFQRRILPKAPNPCRELVRLPIYRFVTTNYDVEIEQALHEDKERRVPFDLFGIDKPPAERALPLSFTQAMRNTELLTRFSLARDNDNRNMVFHCHGRFDQIESIIASENDYQRWYVSDEAGPAFRQTLELLLESNPLLFVGYGMRDEDLLRPLRQLGALDPTRKASRPIFALVFSDDLNKDNPEHELLYERYGLQVIPFTAKRGEDQGAALCRTLQEIDSRFLQACDDWYEKPRTRPPHIPPRARQRELRRPLLIPAFDSETPRRFAPIEVDDQVQTIAQKMEEHEEDMGETRPKKASVICLVGPGGTGKSLNLLALLERVKNDGRFEGSFYWNTHYTNEAFTVLDHAVRYMAPAARNEMRQPMRQERLLDALANHRFLVVVDGCERLLRPARRTWEGRAYSAGLRQILRILGEKISAPGFQSIIVFAGRLWPGELLSAGARIDHEVILHFTDRIRASRLKPQDFSGNAKDVAALCALLRGHSYGLLLARRYLAQGDFKTLLRKLAEQPPKKRFDTMMRLAVDALEKTHRGARALLERMALFTEPISEAIVKRCWDDASRESSGLEEAALATLLAKAVEDRFVLRVMEEESGNPTYAYVVHSSLRGHFRRRDSPWLSLVLPDFAMPGFTARTNGVDPGSARWAKRAESLFEVLCEDWQDCLVPPHRGRGEGRVRNLPTDAAECSRAAFGILRTQWECITAARQKNFDAYGRFGIRLSNRARVASPRTWSYCDPMESETIESEGSPLFIAELAWLYNDVAFGLFSEGLLPDAFAVWEQTYEISRVLESVPPYGEYVVEALLNLTHTLIELGQMADAVQYLDEAARLNAFLLDDEVAYRIMGFRGFCEHVRGSLRRADGLYHAAIPPLAEDGNRRAASFFLTLQAAVVLELGDVERAAQLARESRALAEIGDYPDLVGYARIPEADVLVRRGDFTEARRGYEAVLQDAEKMNARALEAFGRLKLADLSLVQGDAEGARRLAMKTLKTSNALGLGLMATRTLITLARATVRSGDRELGLGYLKIAEQQARRQQYGLRQRDAERYLRELGAEEPDWPRPL